MQSAQKGVAELDRLAESVRGVEEDLHKSEGICPASIEEAKIQIHARFNGFVDALRQREELIEEVERWNVERNKSVVEKHVRVEGVMREIREATEDVRQILSDLATRVADMYDREEEVVEEVVRRARELVTPELMLPHTLETIEFTTRRGG